MSLTRDYNDISGIFGGSKKSGSGLFADNQAVPEKSKSLESMVAPNTKLQTVEVNAPAVDTSKPGAVALNAQNAQKVAGAQQENLRTVASFEKEVKVRASEALDAEKSVDGTAFSPRMDTPTGVELVAGGVVGAKGVALQGLGTLATGGLKAAGAGGKTEQVLNVLNDRKLSSDEARSEVGSILADSSGPDTGQENFGMITQANATDRVAVGANWEGIIKQHGDEAISEVVHYNPNDPSSAFPGVRALKDAISRQDEELDNSDMIGRLALVGGTLSDKGGFSSVPVQAVSLDVSELVKSSGNVIPPVSDMEAGLKQTAVAQDLNTAMST